MMKFTGMRRAASRASTRSTADESATLDLSTSDGQFSVPVRVNGRDAKILVAGYDLGGQRLVWSNSEIMTHAFIGGRDIALLYGRGGESGSTVLRYATRPTVRVLDGTVASSYDPTTGSLRLDYVHNGLARVEVSGGGATLIETESSRISQTRSTYELQALP